MMLEELIKELEKRPADQKVKHGFGYPHADRGNYLDLAFDPVEETTFGEMLKHARYALGRTFDGFKGGEYEMNKWTKVKIGEYGVPGEEITSWHFRYWDLVSECEDNK